MSDYELVTGADDDMWLAERHGGIGASEIAIIMGASEWASNLELYYRKIGESAEDERSEDEWLFWGRTLEDAIRTELCRRAEVTLAHSNVLLRSTAHRWALATPDGLTTDGEPVETKNIAWGYDADEWASQIPRKYYLQCQQQMLVTGADRCLFGALLWGSRLIWEWVPRDATTIQQIVAAGAKFWSHVERRVPPPADGHPGGRRLLARHATDDNAVELFEADISDHLHAHDVASHELTEIRKRERAAKKRLAAADDAIAQQMGVHRKAYTSTGWRFAWTTTEKRGFTVAPSTIERLKIQPPKLD